MHFDLSRSHPQLGLWRATYTVDARVLRHLHVCQMLQFLGALLAVAGVALLFTPKPWIFFILLGLGTLVFLAGACAQPSGMPGDFFWAVKAARRTRWLVDVYADGFVLSDGAAEGPPHRWDDVTALRHPLFRASGWGRDEDRPCYTQKTARLIVELLGGEVLELSEVLGDVETLSETVQREVYPRLLERARRRLAAGQAEPFEPFAVSGDGIRSPEGFLAWPEIEALELKATTLTLKRRSGVPQGGGSADVTRLPNFPVLLALLETEQPDLARDLLDGVPLDSAARLWSRVSQLRAAAAAAGGGREAPDGALDQGPHGPRSPAADEVPDHSGRPNRSNADFFVPPPPEIGPLVSASSTLRSEDRPFTPEARALLLLVAAGLAGSVGLFIVYAAAVSNPFWLTFWLAVPPLIGALIAWGATLFQHTCTYVGIEGVARARCAGHRGRVVERTLFLFRDAAAVRSSLNHRYHKGQYQGSDYVYEWTDASGRSLFRVKGTYRSEKEPPPSVDLYHFGEAAEVAWSLRRLDAAQEELERDGCVRFALKGGGAIRVGPGFVDFGAGGEGYCSVGDLAETSVKDNVLRFRRKDAEEGWFRSRGIYKVALAEVANAKLFLFLLRTLMAFGSTRAGEELGRRPALLDQLAEVAHVPWGHDARASAFVCKSLEPAAAENALRHLRVGTR